jgi:hypothetical protein
VAVELDLLDQQGLAGLAYSALSFGWRRWFF